MPQNLTDTSTYTTPIVIPADTDAADLTYIETMAQGLANRTRSLADKIGGVSGVDEWVYGGSARLRDVQISMLDAKSAIDQTATSGATTVFHHWNLETTSEWRSRKDSGTLIVPLNAYLRDGVEIVDAIMICDPGAARAGGNRMSIALVKVTPDFATPAPGTPEILMTAHARSYDNGSAAIQQVAVSTVGVVGDVVDRDISDYYLVILAGNDGGTNFDKVHGIQISFYDNGPRNF